MARGEAGLKLERKVLAILADGPRNHTELRRELGWSVLGPNKMFDALVRRMRASGMIEPVGWNKGQWRIVDGLQVCPHCLGRGLTSID